MILGGILIRKSVLTRTDLLNKADEKFEKLLEQRQKRIMYKLMS